MWESLSVSHRTARVDAALLASSLPCCSACESMAGFQNSFDSQSVTNVVLFEIFEDNMVSRRPEEQGAVKAVLDDCRFFCLDAKLNINKW